MTFRDLVTFHYLSHYLSLSNSLLLCLTFALSPCLSLYAYISAVSGTSLTGYFVPAFFFFTKLEFISAVGVIDTIYNTESFLRTNCLHPDEDRLSMNNSAGNYANITQRTNLSSQGTTNTFIVTLSSLIDQCRLNLLNNNHNFELRYIYSCASLSPSHYLSLTMLQTSSFLCHLHFSHSLSFLLSLPLSQMLYSYFCLSFCFCTSVPLFLCTSITNLYATSSSAEVFQLALGTDLRGTGPEEEVLMEGDGEGEEDRQPRLGCKDGNVFVCMYVCVCVHV